MRSRALGAAFVALLASPALAAAAPVPDTVVGLSNVPIDIGVYGQTVAYAQTVGNRDEVQWKTGSGAFQHASVPNVGAVDVGKDARNRTVIVYTSCGKRCSVVAIDPATGKKHTVAAGLGTTYDVSVGRGRAVWIEGSTVRSRALAGGAIRREAVAKGVSTVNLDTDGKTIAVTGDYDSEGAEGSTAVSVTKMGSGRATVRDSRDYGEDYAAMRAPVVTPTGVTTLFDYDPASDVSYTFADLNGKTNRNYRSTGGMLIERWDAGGGRQAFITGNTTAGCELGDADADDKIADAPCQIISASLAAERRLPVQLTVANGVATLRTVTLKGDKVTGRTPSPGVQIDVINKLGAVVATLMTDAAGHVTLPDPGDDAYALTAHTPTNPTYAVYGY